MLSQKLYILCQHGANDQVWTGLGIGLGDIQGKSRLDLMLFSVTYKKRKYKYYAPLGRLFGALFSKKKVTTTIKARMNILLNISDASTVNSGKSEWFSELDWMRSGTERVSDIVRNK